MTKFKVGDKVIYKGEQSVIVTTDKKYCKPSDCIVEYSNGWGRDHYVPSDYRYTKYDTYRFAYFENLELVEEQPTYKFKVGDRVKVRLNHLVSSNGHYCFDEMKDRYQDFKNILTVSEIVDDNKWNNRCVVGEIIENSYQQSVCFHDDELELVKEECVPSSWSDTTVGTRAMSSVKVYVSKNLSIKKETIMSKLTTFVKNSLLSADEKALRQVGLKTDCGEYTQEAIDLVLQELCKEKEARLIEVANGLLAEDKKNK